VRFNVRNFGEDAHDLVVRSRGGRVVADSGEIRSGRVATVAARLRRGRYLLLCTKGDHAARGMKARLRVASR
jgi:hypothetical protein